MIKAESRAEKIIFLGLLILIAAIIGFTTKNQKIENDPIKMTKVVNINHSSYDEYIGRGTEYRTHMNSRGIQPGEKGWLGNPHPIGWCDICQTYHSREECIQAFKKDFYRKINNDSVFQKAVLQLRGKRLGCYCKPKACHGDVIKAWIESQPIERKKD